ncbi:MAG TPA: PKD domain-containing protein, partial [Solirubrobacterales bacterium]
EAREKQESRRTAAIGDVAIDAAGDVIGVWTYFDGSDRVAQAALRPAAGGFGAPEPLTEPGESANDLDLAMDAAGDATAIWNRLEGSTWFVRRAERAAGGGFGSPQDLSQAQTPINSPEIAISAGGATVVVWRLAEKNRSTIEASSRPAGGSFSAPAGVSSGIDNALSPDLAMNAAGDTVVVWSGESGGEQNAKAAVRPRGGAFGAPAEIAEVKPAFFLPHPALDAAGNAIVVWLRNDGVSEIVQAAAYDAQPPELRDVSIPTSAEVGEVVRFSAKGLDAWPTDPPSFDFGDGSGAVGESVSHAYGAPGTYPVSASVVDAVGNPASAAASISVLASNRFSLGRLRRNRRKGTAVLAVRVPGPGELSLLGSGVARIVRRAPGAGEVELPVKAWAGAARRLARHGRARLRLRIHYAPDGGPPAVQELAVVLRKSGAAGGRRRSRH